MFWNLKNKPGHHVLIVQVLYLMLLGTNLCYAADSGEAKNEKLKEFEKYFITTLMQDVPGAALVVFENGQISLKNAYGVKRLGDKDKVTTDTVFRLASVSKTFASAATAKVLTEYEMSWDTPITTYLGFLRFKKPDYGQQITLKKYPVPEYRPGSSRLHKSD